MSRYSVHCDTLDWVASNLARGLLIRSIHDDVIKWKHIPRYWPFVRGIHRSPVNFPHKGQWCGALEFSLIRARRNGWVNNPSAGDLGRHRTHYDVIATSSVVLCFLGSSGEEMGEQMCWHYQTRHDKRDTRFKLLNASTSWHITQRFRVGSHHLSFKIIFVWATKIVNEQKFLILYKILPPSIS